MPIRIYNTLTREKEVFEPLDPDRLGRGLLLRGDSVHLGEVGA